MMPPELYDEEEPGECPDCEPGDPCALHEPDWAALIDART